MIGAVLLVVICVVSARGIGPGGLSGKEKFRAVTMPPTPPASTCRHIGGYDLSPIINEPVNWQNPPNSDSFVAYSICGTLEMACGEAGTPCAGTSSNCCGGCQGWVEADGPQTANLGIYTSYRFDRASNVISIIYTGGDPVGGVPRALMLNLTCNISAGLLTTTNFIQPSTRESYEPYWYWYYLEAQTSLMCPNCTSYNNCRNCSQSQSNCSWCLDTSQCLGPNQVAKCSNRVKNPKMCPATCSLMNSCESCTTAPYPCEWCFDNGRCLPYGNPCNNVVNNVTYCHL